MARTLDKLAREQSGYARATLITGICVRQAGMATYSPRLDAHGTGDRGIEAWVDSAGQLGLHVFDCLNIGSSLLDALVEPVSD